MSIIDLEKEKIEVESFKEAIVLSKGKNNETEQLLNQLNGEIVNRSKNDRPDIIVKRRGGRRNEDIYIGIEHFIIDQASEQKGTKVVSKGKENYKHLQRIFEEGKIIQDSGQDVPEELKSGLIDDVFKYADSAVNKNYETLLSTFQVILKKHYESAESYRQNIKDIAKGAKVKVAFLIEIISYFNHMFFVENYKFRENSSCLLPITEEVIDLLGRISRKKVDYIILLLKNTMEPKIADVIAIRPEKIRKQMERQHVTVYRYCGSAITIITKVADKVKLKDKYRINYKQYIKGADETTWHIKCLKLAIDAVKYGVPIVLDRSIASLLYAFGSGLKFEKIAEDEYELRPDRNQAELVEKLEEFIQLFPNTK